MNKNKPERIYLPASELRVQPNADGTKTLTGYGIVYNSPSCDLGGFTEVVAPGAVTESLRQNPSILFLRDHDNGILLGRAPKTLSLSDDSVGLRFACNLPPTPNGEEVAVLVARGDLPGCSFSFRAIGPGADSWHKGADGKPIRTLKKISISELSVVSVPAYKATTASLRSCPPEFRSLLRSMPDDEDDGDDCDCDCPECLAGDCADCSNPDGDSEDCGHGESSNRSVDLWRLNTRISLALANQR